jgi:hypothetical protein
MLLDGGEAVCIEAGPLFFPGFARTRSTDEHKPHATDDGNGGTQTIK